MLRDHRRTRLDTIDDEGGHHQRHDRVLGNAEAHQGNEACSRRCFVGGGLPGYAFDGAVPDLISILAELLVDAIGRELRDHRPAAWHNAKDRAHDAAAQRAREDAFELWPRRQELDRAVERRSLLLVVEIFGDLSDAEATERDTDQM